MTLKCHQCVTQKGHLPGCTQTKVAFGYAVPKKFSKLFRIHHANRPSAVGSSPSHGVADPGQAPSIGPDTPAYQPLGTAFGHKKNPRLPHLGFFLPVQRQRFHMSSQFTKRFTQHDRTNDLSHINIPEPPDKCHAKSNFITSACRISPVTRLCRSISAPHTHALRRPPASPRAPLPRANRKAQDHNGLGLFLRSERGYAGVTSIFGVSKCQLSPGAMINCSPELMKNTSAAATAAIRINPT